MDNFLDKIFFRSRNLDYISQNLIDLTKQTTAHKIFEALNSYSDDSEVRYVGGCVRKIIKKQNVDDIDLATNLRPNEVCDALKKKQINYYETGIDHGTITAIIEDNKYEITSLRKDISTDGRHAKVEFSLDWKEDATRRDFSINSIYSDKDGNLFDPYNGKKDLERGKVNFIGDAENRIKEDYLRILRYVRFFINYSNQDHDPKIIKIIKKNIDGVSKLSSERLLDEFKKLLESSGEEKIVFFGMPDLYSIIKDDQYLLLDGLDEVELDDDEYADLCANRHEQDLTRKISQIEHYFKEISTLVDKVILYRTTSEPVKLNLPSNVIDTDLNIVDKLRETYKPYNRGYFDSRAYSSLKKEFLKLLWHSSISLV